MRIPLIVAARPSIDFKSPRVHLRTGKWTFTSDHVDSVLLIESNSQSMDVTGILELFSPSAVTISFSLVGKESSITVYACLTL